MYSIIDVNGKQYTVKEGDVLVVDLLDKNKNDKVEFDKVLLTNKDDKDIKIGTPYVSGAKVLATVLENQRDEKVIVFKYKRRKNYKRMKGHKQPYTMIKIDKIKLGDWTKNFNW